MTAAADEYRAALAVACPFCDVEIGEFCVVRSTPFVLRVPHFSRVTAAREFMDGLELDPTGEIEARSRYGG